MKAIINPAEFWYGRINKHPEDATKDEVFRIMESFAKQYPQSQLPKEGEEVYVWQKVKTPLDLPEYGWNGAWRYEGSGEINSGNRDTLYDNSHLGESVEWLKSTTLSLPTEEEIAQERYQKGVLSLNERATDTGEFGYIVVCELMKIAAGLTLLKEKR